MAARYPNPRLVKIHRNYTVEEVAALLGKHKNTVRDWIRQGLPAITEKKPALILGPDLRKFLEVKRSASKQPCKPGEMYCFRCRVPKMPYGNMADYVPRTAILGKLIGLCPDCDTRMHQRASFAKVERLRSILDIRIPQAQRHIVDSA